jgi:hypothetical protein
MTDMSEDPKIKRIIRKHGGMAYAVYNYVLERIAKRLETDSPEPDLEESAEDIADFLHYDTVKVEEIMLACLHEGLFEQHEVTGRILCRKAYKFIEKSQTRSGEMRKMITAYAGMSETVSDSPGQSQTVRDNPDRTEQKKNRRRTEEEQKQKKTSATSVYETADGIQLPINQTRYNRLSDEYGEKTLQSLIEQAYRHSLKKKGDASYYKDYTAAAEDYAQRQGTPKRPRESKGKVDVRSLKGAPDYD